MCVYNAAVIWLSSELCDVMQCREQGYGGQVILELCAGGIILLTFVSFCSFYRAMRNRGVEIYLPGDNAGMITMEGQRNESRGLTSMTMEHDT